MNKFMNLFFTPSYPKLLLPKFSLAFIYFNFSILMCVELLFQYIVFPINSYLFMQSYCNSQFAKSILKFSRTINAASGILVFNRFPFGNMPYLVIISHFDSNCATYLIQYKYLRYIWNNADIYLLHQL